MKRILGAAFALSLGLNAFLIYENCFGHTDFVFYPTGLRRAYYVKGLDRNSFIIEHEGHRFTAKCRVSLTWPDGPDNPGRPMSDGTCTYMPSMVGKSIAEGLMRHEGNSLVYLPWADSDTVQTADILTITGDEPR
jgi:hypothetical protein